jgi:hypothetical protein
MCVCRGDMELFEIWGSTRKTKSSWGALQLPLFLRYVNDTERKFQRESSVYQSLNLEMLLLSRFPCEVLYVGAHTCRLNAVLRILPACDISCSRCMCMFLMVHLPNYQGLNQHSTLN